MVERKYRNTYDESPSTFPIEGGYYVFEGFNGVYLLKSTLNE